MLMERIRTLFMSLCALFGFGVMNAQVMDASKIAVAEPEFDMDALIAVFANGERIVVSIPSAPFMVNALSPVIPCSLFINTLSARNKENRRDEKRGWRI